MQKIRLPSITRKITTGDSMKLRWPKLLTPTHLSQMLQSQKCPLNETLIRNGVPSLASYSAMAGDLYSEGSIEDANMVLDEMRKRGFWSSVETYEAKLSALCRERSVGLAVDVIEEEMVTGNCVPRVGTYNILVKGLCAVGESVRAVGYLKKMDKQVGCVTDRETYSILVDGLCCEGRFVDASKVMEKMLDKRYWPSSSAYNRLIKGLCSEGRRYEAVLLLEEMVGQGMIPEVSLWKSLVQLASSDLNEASCCIETFYSLQTAGQRPEEF